MNFMELAQKRKELQKQYEKGTRYADSEMRDIKKRATSVKSSVVRAKNVRKKTK